MNTSGTAGALSGTFRVMLIGFAINAVSGLMLFAADASTKGSTRLFGGKMALVVLGVVMALATRRALADGQSDSTASTRTRLLAAGSLLVWATAITAGRMMAYL